MKILLISSLYGPYAVGGAERVVQTLAEGLVERRHEVRVLTTPPKNESRQDLVINGVVVEFTRLRNIYHPFRPGIQPGILGKALFHAVDSWNPTTFRLMREQIRDFKPDVVNSHNITGFSPLIFTAVRKLGVPLVHTLHDQYLLCPKTTMFRGDNCIRQCWSCLPYSIVRGHSAKADLVVGVSEFIIKRHLDFGIFRSATTQVIRNASPPPDVIAPVRPGGPVRFGFLGQIKDTKGLHILIEAFLSECVGNEELLIAGRGDFQYEKQLRDATEGHPRIRWLGFTNSRSFLESIDILVVPSLWNDTAPLVVYEAFAASRPVIGSNRGGIPELIEPGAGWVFDPSNLGQLRSILRMCANDEALVLKAGRKAREVSETHSEGKFLDEYEQAYKNLLK